MRGRKYVHDYAYEDVQPITCNFVSDDINSTTVYIVPSHASEKMNHCIRTRPWGMAKLVKVSRSQKSRDYYKTVEEAIVLQTSNAKTLQALGLTDWNSRKEKAAYLPGGRRLILEKDTEKKIIKAKHYGTHSCPVQVKSRNKNASKLAKAFPRLTRESMVRQNVQQQLKQP